MIAGAQQGNTMEKIFFNPQQKKRASTLLALGVSESEAAGNLIEAGLFREAVVHLYFTCFYISQALLCHVLRQGQNKHEHVEAAFHKEYGRKPWFPKRYLKLHSLLHKQRTQYNYKTTHTPDPGMLKSQYKSVLSYVGFASKVVPQVEIGDVLKSIIADNPDKVKDYSFDLYCPRTYSHHTRLTFWQPPFYLSIFGVKKMQQYGAELLRKLRVRKSPDYVIGLNSKVNQYRDDHLLMIDIDAVNPAVESVLKPLGGVLLKSGRGYHFIAKRIISGRSEWHRAMKKLLRSKALKPHIDRAHVELSLKRNYSTLRVTASPVKPQIPSFYKEI